jgi:hypothetical protein
MWLSQSIAPALAFTMCSDLVQIKGREEDAFGLT